MCVGLVLIVDFPVEPSLLLDRNPRWRSHLLSRIEADPLVGFAWSAWSSCYYSGASLGFLVEIPLLLIVFFGSTGGRRSLLLGFGLQSCKPILISIFAGWLLKDIFELFIPTVVNYCCYLVWVCAYARFVCCDWLAREINLYYYSWEYNCVLELVAIGWDFISLVRVLILKQENCYPYCYYIVLKHRKKDCFYQISHIDILLSFTKQKQLFSTVKDWANLWTPQACPYQLVFRDRLLTVLC